MAQLAQASDTQAVGRGFKTIKIGLKIIFKSDCDIIEYK